MLRNIVELECNINDGLGRFNEIYLDKSFYTCDRYILGGVYVCFEAKYCRMTLTLTKSTEKRPDYTTKT